MKKIIVSLVAILIATMATFAQTKLTENTIRIDKDSMVAQASAEDMDWITGTWEGKAFGGSVKEVWTKSEGGSKMGMFSLVKDGKPVFYEFLTFSENDGQLSLKLKHFNPDMTGWEEKDKFVTFRFFKRNGNRYYFQGLTFENAGADKLNIYLALTQKDKSYKEEVFKFTRVR